MNDPELFAEFVDAATKELSKRDGVPGLEATGWLEYLQDPTADNRREAILAVFTAQGRCLALTPALGLVVASVLTELVGSSVAYSFVLDVTRDRVLVAAPTDPVITDLLLTDPDGRLATISVASTMVAERQALDPTYLTVRRIDTSDLCWLGDVGEVVSQAAGDTARLAIAAEILGCCDGLLDSATEYARDRVQFGQPIGALQAVRHILAAAAVEAQGLRALSSRTAGLGGQAPDSAEAALLIAAADRAGRRVLDLTSQVLGAQGFLQDHVHHRFQRRILTLAAILGTPVQLLANAAATRRSRPFELQRILASSQGEQ